MILNAKVSGVPSTFRVATARTGKAVRKPWSARSVNPRSHESRTRSSNRIETSVMPHVGDRGVPKTGRRRIIPDGRVGRFQLIVIVAIGKFVGEKTRLKSTNERFVVQNVSVIGGRKLNVDLIIPSGAVVHEFLTRFVGY